MSFYQKGSRVDRGKREQSDRNYNPFNEKNWIGAEAAKEGQGSSAQVGFEKSKTEWIDKREEPRSERKPQAETRITLGHESNVSRGVTIGNKSPIELMQDILKGVRQGEEVRSYYSQEAEESLSELLTNKFKLSSYVKKL